MIVLGCLVLGAVLLVSGVSKVAAPQLWRAQSGELGVPATVAAVVPFVELAVGALLVAQVARQAVAIAAGALLVAFTALLLVRLSQGRRTPCACFGSLSSRPIGWIDVVRNTLLLALAVALAR